MSSPFQQVPNSDNSPAGLGNTSLLNLNGVGNGNQTPYTIPTIQPFNLDPQNQPPVMKTFVYSPDIRVQIATENGMEFDVSADVVRGTLLRAENSASTFVCELANKSGQYTKDGGLFNRMDRITVYMKRVNWVQVFSGYLDTVPFAQMWAGNVNIKATCTLKRLLYTYWNPNLAQSRIIFNQMNIAPGGVDIQGRTSLDAGLGDLLGNLICWVGGWSPQNVHIQDFPLTFFAALEQEFLKVDRNADATARDFKTMLLGYDHSPGPGSAAGMKTLSTGPGLGPQVVDPAGFRQQIIKAVDDLGMGPKTKDIQDAYGIQEYSATGQATEEAAVAQALQQNAALGQRMQSQARTTDAAILAFACVYAESAWMMLANAAVPDSLNFPNQGLSPDHDSIGLFQQRNQGWGTVAQRMNAYASAVMFLDALAKVSGWDNMDPAEAIARVQINRDGAATYRPFIAVATQEVQAIRAGQGKFTPQSIAGIGTSSIESLTTGQSVMGAVGSAINGVPGVVQNNPAPGALPVAMPGKPVPDAQGAVNASVTTIGQPYIAGGNSLGEGFDGPGLIHYLYNTIGRDVGRTVSQQTTNAREKVPSLALAQPGDVLEINGGQHVAMVTTPAGATIVDAQPGIGVKAGPIYFNPAEITGIYRYTDWGGPDPTAPFNPVAGPGMPMGTGYVGGAGSAGSTGQQEPIARNLFSYVFTPQSFAPTVADLFTGQKSFIDCEPLIQETQAVCRSGLRNFCSAPNGDFIAYYPDYFGVDGKPISMTIEDIEMKDVRINLSDDAMTTHVYVAGDLSQVGETTQALAWLSSSGVATVENETLYQRLRRVVPGGGENINGEAVLQKYGVRPLQLEFSSLGDNKLEFLVACQLFMQKWAEQYETTASFTFMPELFPGMRVALGNTGIAVYVSDVTHNFDWEEGFSTTAKIMAPSSTNGGQVVNGFIPTVLADGTVTNLTPTTVPGG